jgi:hypothetical protein
MPDKPLAAASLDLKRVAAHVEYCDQPVPRYVAGIEPPEEPSQVSAGVHAILVGEAQDARLA